ncbi:MAG: CAP domain-containing protein [Candidatus Saccharicenans sp.]|nr:CAP domain-containing protein [Candidatus Saccharicenans sp.]
MRPESSGKKRRCQVCSGFLGAITILIAISSTFAWLPDQKNRAKINPATQALARLKEAQYYSSQPPAGQAISGSQSYVLEKILPGVLRDLDLRWEPDPRLSSLCRWLNELYEVDFSPDAVAVSESAGWLGLPEPLPHSLLMRVPSEARLPSLIKERLSKLENAEDYTHYGALAEVHSPGLLTVIIAFSSRHLFLSPVPRKLKGTGEVEMKMGTLPGFTDPIIIHTPPEGEPEIIPVAGENSSLHPASIRLAFRSFGKHKVEVIARNERGPAVLANLDVCVGSQAPEFSGSASDLITTWEQSASAVREKLYVLINEERARAGLNRLERDQRLEEIAGKHSLDMARNNFAGHVSPTTGGPDDRLRAAGIQFSCFGENVGLGYTSAEDIHRGFMDSPGHRMILLDPRYTHFGVGVETRGYGPQKAFLVTELFIRPGQTMMTGSSRQLLERASKIRMSAGLNLVEEQPELSTLAQRAADEFSQKEDIKMEELQLYLINTALAEKLNYERLSAVVITASTEDEIVDRISREQKMPEKVGLGIKKVTTGRRAGKILAILLY